MKLRAWLLVFSYLLLIAIVVFETFWIGRQFDNSHDDQCAIAKAQAETAVAVADAPPRSPRAVAALNEAIRTLNDTCDFHIEEIQ